MIRPFTPEERRLIGYQSSSVEWVIRNLPPKVYRGLVLRTGSPEDVSQSVWLELCKLRARQQVRSARPTRFVLSEVLAILARQSRRRQLRTGWLAFDEQKFVAPEDGKADDAEEAATLLAGLSPHQAECLRRHYLDGDSQSEIARSLGVTQRAVWAAIERGLGNLRKAKVRSERV